MAGVGLLRSLLLHRVEVVVAAAGAAMMTASSVAWVLVRRAQGSERAVVRAETDVGSSLVLLSAARVKILTSMRWTDRMMLVALTSTAGCRLLLLLLR